MHKFIEWVVTKFKSVEQFRVKIQEKIKFSYVYVFVYHSCLNLKVFIVFCDIFDNLSR